MTEYRAPGVRVDETDSGAPPHGGGPVDPRRREPETVELDVPTLVVSLAVHLVEGATGDEPIEVPEVSIEGVDAEPRPKSDRFLLFLDVELPTPPTPAVVSVDGGDRYRDATHRVVVTDRDDLEVPAEVEVFPPSSPVVTVWLFAEDATVLRGYVRDTDGNRIRGGEIRVTDLDVPLSAPIDPNGRFVLHFEDAPDDNQVDVELDVDELATPATETIAVAGGTETVRTLVVDVAAGTITVEEGVM